MAAVTEPVQLVGEIVRPFGGPVDLTEDKLVFYPSLRPSGEQVGSLYAVLDDWSGERHHVAHYFNGRVVCHCQAAQESRGRRNCEHGQAVRERKAKEAGGRQ